MPDIYTSRPMLDLLAKWPIETIMDGDVYALGLSPHGGWAWLSGGVHQWIESTLAHLAIEAHLTRECDKRMIEITRVPNGLYLYPPKHVDDHICGYETRPECALAALIADGALDEQSMLSRCRGCGRQFEKVEDAISCSCPADPRKKGGA